MFDFPHGRAVLTYGTFDGLGPAQSDLLRQLSRLGTELIVGCSTDAFARSKGQTPIMPYADRRRLLESCRFVSRVIAEDDWNQKRTDIVNYDVCVFAMGSDWTGRFDDLGDVTEVRYITQPARALAPRQRRTG
ncbi:adenylyltransferase/cytidyltransferase family protein [Sulfitobacter sp. S190]|uniref:adenylyltransferase/cytidyltransferase family protein n=1 Tax=Sulfitobacter sp. S190 TaxID=2867022 RepID=UPI0021A89965|nr:adenylyltransferase/cytidyltransferase family protein [Sulfitobacter sp. S190]UWR24023.1 adenylyltransferase/cytidyltransferase family protein [Sulfitobacter sp. S190]